MLNDKSGNTYACFLKMRKLQKCYVVVVFFRTALYGREIYFYSPHPPFWNLCPLHRSCWMLIWRHELWTQLEEGRASKFWEGQGPSFRRGSFWTPSHHACAAFWRHDLSSCSLFLPPSSLPLRLLTGSIPPVGQQPHKCNVSVVDFSFSLLGQRQLSSIVIHFGACC